MDSTPKPRGRPATGQTPKRYIRAGHLWDEAAELAAERNETMTALVLRAIEREVRRLRRRVPATAAVHEVVTYPCTCEQMPSGRRSDCPWCGGSGVAVRSRDKTKSAAE